MQAERGIKNNKPYTLTDGQRAAIEELVSNAVKHTAAVDTGAGMAVRSKQRFFRSYKIKDVVFLAVITAVTLLTGGIMPLLIHIPIGAGYTVFAVSGHRHSQGKKSRFFDTYVAIWRGVACVHVPTDVFLYGFVCFCCRGRGLAAVQRL